ncbi:MAG: CHC2 zinc finger domain-containing protein [Candidatus Hodarchaeota archaeon]
MLKNSKKIILENIDILPILKKYNIRVEKRSGQEICVLCPFHDDHEPSLYINLKTKLFKCFGCDKKGNIITFISKLEKISYNEAVQRLLSDSTLSEDYETKLRKIKEKMNLKNVDKKKTNKRNFEIYQSFIDSLPLLSNYPVYNYLSSKRYIPVEILNRQRIKLLHGKSIKGLRKIYTNEELLESGLFKKKDDDIKFISRNHLIVIPFYYDDRVVGIQLRIINDKTEPKYLNIGDILCPYNINEIKKSDVIYIVEGVIDTLSLLSMNKPAIGLIGVQNFKKNWKDFLVGCRQVKILFDNDAAGELGAKKLKLFLEESRILVKIITIDKKFKDINEYWCHKKK